MIPDKNEIKYKNLFSKNEEITDIPEFDDILNFPVRQKSHSGHSVTGKSFIIVGLILLIGIVYFLIKPTGESSLINENGIVQNKKSLLWEWTSPTQLLLTTSLSNPFTNANMPTDFLSLKNISLQSNNTIKINEK